MKPAAALPPLPELAAALRKTTEHLAREVVEPQAAPPDWNELEWAIARCSAAIHGISVLLGNRLRWAGPPQWQTFIAEQRRQSLLRHARIGTLLERVDAATQRRGIRCIALKGAALRALELHGPGERPMADIDLLVAPEDLAAVAHAMADIDYAEAFNVQRHAVYRPRGPQALHELGEHVDNPLKIEVHTTIAERLPARPVDVTKALWRGTERPGLNGYPDRPALLLHLLLHMAANIRSRALRHIQLTDIAAVGRLLSSDEWRTLLGPRRDAEKRWWLFPPLELVARYYPASIPGDVLRAARALCPPLLRLATERQALSDVSWSNIRMHAFPGIAWSRTPLDALLYIRGRVLPSRSALADIKAGLKGLPELDRLPWYGVSHARRIALWLCSRPPRIPTMNSVRAALESTDARAAENA